MAYVIGGACIDELDGSCVQVCPVDCIYEGDRKRYINPTDCIDCGACLPECPVEAIFAPHEPEAGQWAGTEDAFFAQALPGRAAPLGDPGGAYSVGRVGTDPPFVAAWSAPDPDSDREQEDRTTP